MLYAMEDYFNLAGTEPHGNISGIIPVAPISLSGYSTEIGIWIWREMSKNEIKIGFDNGTEVDLCTIDFAGWNYCRTDLPGGVTAITHCRVVRTAEGSKGGGLYFDALSHKEAVLKRYQVFETISFAWMRALFIPDGSWPPAVAKKDWPPPPPYISFAIIFIISQALRSFSLTRLSDIMIARLAFPSNSAPRIRNRSFTSFFS